MGMRTRLWRQRGLNCLARNQYEQAEQYLRKVYEAEPGVQGSSYNLGVALMGLKRFDESQQFLLGDLEAYGESFVRFRSLGDLHYMWGNPQDAAAWYRKALGYCEQEPEERMLKKRIKKCASPESFAHVMKGHEAFDEGNRLIILKRFEEALDQFSLAAEYDSTQYLAMNNIGTLYHMYFKESEKALKMFERAARYSSMPSLIKNMEVVKKALEKKG